MLQGALALQPLHYLNNNIGSHACIAWVHGPWTKIGLVSIMKTSEQFNNANLGKKSIMLAFPQRGP